MLRLRKYTLVFSITTLHFFVDSFLDLPLENACSCWLIEPGSFEYMRCIYPIITSPSHNTVGFELVFIYWNLGNVSYTALPNKGHAQGKDSRS